MTSVSSATNALWLMNSLGKAGGANAAAAFSTNTSPADAADPSVANPSMLPGVPAISLDTLLALQGDHTKAPSLGASISAHEETPEQKFLDEAQKTPMQRMRDDILRSLGLSEDALAQMPADQRRAAEDKIRQLIEEKLKQGMGVDHAEATAQTPAEALSALI